MISSREVSRSWKSWLAASDAEVQSLVEEKEALKKITRKELEIQEKAAQQGRTVEIIPSKLIFTIKAGLNGGKRKTRWVVCGNYKSKKDSEQTFSSGAGLQAVHLGSSPTSMRWSSHQRQDCFSQRLDGSGRPRGHPDCEATSAVY